MDVNAQKSFSTMLRELGTDLYNHSISYDDYRLQRRRILDQVDHYYNGANLPSPSSVSFSDDTLPGKLGEYSASSEDITEKQYRR